jgi:hypothetical protein
MALLFLSTTGEWVIAQLTQPAYALSAGPVPLYAVKPGRMPGQACAHLCRLAGAGAWALLTRDPNVRVNGSPALAGLRLLHDRDEICMHDARLFFSTERLPQVEPIPDLGRPVACARCRSGLEPGTSGVVCPRCGAWCHETPELPCWSYGPACPFCEQRTDAETYSWTPSEL